MLNDIIEEGGAALAYGAVGVALLALGFLVVEVTTPGKLGRQIWTEGNRGAALILAAKLVGVGAIITTAIATSEDGLADGLVSTAVYGVLGIIVMTLAFYLLDVLTPGSLGAIVVGHEGETPSGQMAPACWVVAATDLAIAAIVAAAIA
ncbi:Uncharacterized membrane protein YjfL, UPF0719 family [Thermomonospora echinospora]|uniref:Uncharacterized membrane protein YjfL, UPF0719 family n=1 Tax=Thermomonospora echinospora TaxID=1992 RepID=A0A1H6A372_9ACTN|nr:DUF350 domain-containing protein [Thermomonospora echinospora]SEG42505.1 Uncharacterized membrane protein YjfL, UPF0719 family [Thermomonospora echinospora]